VRLLGTLVTGVVGTALLEAALSSASSAGRVGGLIGLGADAIAWLIDPSVPAIPARAASSSSSSSAPSSSSAAARPATPVVPSAVPGAGP
jgi:predicted lipid-binding transport protein (Tim44 family)